MEINNNIRFESSRIRREWKTINIMIRYYCRKNHSGNDNICKGCNDLIDYAYQRLLNCPFDEKKPVCSGCTVHCYRKDKRELVRKVMRYSGPRMLLKHPYLAVMHLIDEKITK